MTAYYIRQPDGQLTLQYGAPPAGYVQVGGGGLPSAPSMVTYPTQQPLASAQSMVVTDQQPQYTSSMAAGFFGATHGIGNAITGAGSGVANATGSVVHGLGNAISSGDKAVLNGVGSATHSMGNAMSAYMPEMVSNATGTVVHGTGNAISYVNDGLDNVTSGMTRGIGNGITAVGSGVSNAFGSAEKALESNFQTTPGTKTKKSKKKKSSGFGCC
eukprot:TRINITY_DN3214_c0_g1_i16.p1 TRINITY_DN3214_c0_g1~~TRINITY_DN3214_c0_g1_i16.p1  ORF type:complete len:215 (-),score=50.33 TRINITY_DN3214_c0_g1_i16:180-824(-)